MNECTCARNCVLVTICSHDQCVCTQTVCSYNHVCMQYEFADASTWIADTNSSECLLCQRSFSMMTRSSAGAGGAVLLLVLLLLLVVQGWCGGAGDAIGSVGGVGGAIGSAVTSVVVGVVNGVVVVVLVVPGGDCSDAVAAAATDSPFTLSVFRRHHCRRCGLLLCDKCSRKQVLCKTQKETKERVLQHMRLLPLLPCPLLPCPLLLLLFRMLLLPSLLPCPHCDSPELYLTGVRWVLQHSVLAPCPGGGCCQIKWRHTRLGRWKCDGAQQQQPRAGSGGVIRRRCSWGDQQDRSCRTKQQPECRPRTGQN